jgi:hypothetical protein
MHEFTCQMRDESSPSRAHPLWSGKTITPHLVIQSTSATTRREKQLAACDESLASVNKLDARPVRAAKRLLAVLTWRFIAERLGVTMKRVGPSRIHPLWSGKTIAPPHPVAAGAGDPARAIGIFNPPSAHTCVPISFRARPQQPGVTNSRMASEINMCLCYNFVAIRFNDVRR